MRFLGVELAGGPAPSAATARLLVLLDDDGLVSRVEQVDSLPAVAATVARLVTDEPFLLGVDVPVVVAPRSARARPVENLVRRRFGFRLPPGGRASLADAPLGLAGEALIAGLATAGLPCLPFPDRAGRRSGLGETHAGLALKTLLWETRSVESTAEPAAREELFRAYAAPEYRTARTPARSDWATRGAALELVLRLLGDAPGYDLQPARNELARASSESGVERAGALLDAALIAGTARRYATSPETSLFVGDQEKGYLILPADGLVRRVALSDARTGGAELFPQTSLRDRLAADAKLREVDLLSVPGRPLRLEATFSTQPRYEFDNVDEMLWWKHCRHLSGPRLPIEGLCELMIALDSDHEGADEPLSLVRSRHRTLSFRFDPPGRWRTRVPTRDGRTYPFRIIRAVFETLP